MLGLQFQCPFSVNTALH